jgi:hypothetical protein
VAGNRSFDLELQWTCINSIALAELPMSTLLHLAKTITRHVPGMSSSFPELRGRASSTLALSTSGSQDPRANVRDAGEDSRSVHKRPWLRTFLMVTPNSLNTNPLPTITIPSQSIDQPQLPHISLSTSSIPDSIIIPQTGVAAASTTFPRPLPHVWRVVLHIVTRLRESRRP